MKKWLCLLLIFSMIFTAYIGCGQEGADEPVDGNEDVVVDIDFNGQHFYFSPYLVELYFPLDGDTSWGDKMLARYKQLEEDYNCVLECVDMDSDRDTATSLISRFASGIDLPDIIDRETRVSYPLYKSGDVLVPIDEITTLDITDEKWGPEYLLQNSKFEGRFYGLFPYAWESTPEFHGIILVNNLLINQFGLTNPYELQEQKNWTWDSFRQELVSATRTEGENSYVGMMLWEAGSIPEDLLITAAFSNGAKMIEEIDGAMKFGLTNPQALAGFEYVAGLYADKVLIKAGNYDGFKNNEAVYLFGLSHMGTGSGKDLIPNVMEDYGMLPFPSGPAAPEGNCSAFISYERRLYVLRSGQNEPDDVGTVMNYLFSPLDDKGGWKNTLEDQIVHHPEDFKNFIYMVENCQFNYMSQLDTAYNKIADNLKKVLTGGMTAAQSMESIEEAVNSQISSITFE
ncbi:MAG: extracellular solute-binding protein family 1 [Clostridia bacterium]|nr:extracellular solute-binding protein family 1 [Clostridia bacterium]